MYPSTPTNALWSTRLNMVVRKISLIYQTEAVRVYRMAVSNDSHRTIGSSIIVKCLLQSGEVEFMRNIEIQGFVEQHMPVTVAHILDTGIVSNGHSEDTSETVNGRLFWIAYEDVQVHPRPWNAYRTRRSIEELAEIHTTEVSTNELSKLNINFKSHTPELMVLQRDLQAFGRVKLCDALKHFTVGPGARRRILCLYDSAMRERWSERCCVADQVVSHGDAHYGNILWSGSSRRPTWIDWEFVHKDLAYFDLFQLLDATSPTTPFRMFISRREALNTYLKKAKPKLSPAERQVWVRGYLHFSAVHLLWILTRIEGDRFSNRFEAHGLKRQFGETVRGLLSIHSHLISNP